MFVVSSTEGSLKGLAPLHIQHIQGGVILFGLGLVLALVKEDILNNISGGFFKQMFNQILICFLANGFYAEKAVNAGEMCWT